MSMPDTPVTVADLAVFEDKWKELFTAQAETALRQSAVLASVVVALGALISVVKRLDGLDEEAQVQLDNADGVMRVIAERVDTKEGLQELADLAGTNPERQN